MRDDTRVGEECYRLFTPGPGNLSPQVRSALAARDWGSRDADFKVLTDSARRGLLGLLDDSSGVDCVLLPGSGTSVVEAALTSLVPRAGSVLVVVNGAYGERMAEIVARSARPVITLELPYTRAVSAAALDEALSKHGSVSHVAFVHAETTAGVLNPLDALIDVCGERGKRVLIDAMSTFGALPMPTAGRFMHVDAIMASANKCLQGAPGVAFAFVSQAAIRNAAGNASTLSLDLHAQWLNFHESGEWRFTPPTHVVAALNAALKELEREGGASARLHRYQAMHDIVVDGLQALGFPMLVPKSERAPVIATFGSGPLAEDQIPNFLRRLRARGCIAYVVV